jgi:CheY-like chemotaxis protein
MKKILLVEDDEAIRKSVIDLFEISNYHVKAVVNGRLAVEQLAQFTPDIVVTDIMMPEMDGVELLTEIKRNPRWKDIPVIMLTAKVMVNDRLEALSLGADGYIAKPFRIEELLFTIRNAISLKESVTLKAISNKGQGRPAESNASFLANLNKLMEDHLSDEQFSLEVAAGFFRMSISGFQKRLKRLSGKSFSEYLNSYKLGIATTLINTGKYSMKEVAAITGYHSATYFSTSFKAHFGHSPSKTLKNR